MRTTLLLLPVLFTITMTTTTNAQAIMQTTLASTLITNNTNTVDNTASLPILKAGINQVSFDDLGATTICFNQINGQFYLNGELNETGTLSFAVVGMECNETEIESVKTYNAGKCEERLDMRNLPAGIYLVQVGFESASGITIAKTFKYQLSK